MSRNKREGIYTPVTQWGDVDESKRRRWALKYTPVENRNRRARNDNKMMWRALREHRYSMGFSEGELP